MIELFSKLARQKKIYIVAGTFPVLSKDESQLFNDSFVFGPSGSHDVQGKLHMTRFENEEWLVSPRSSLKVFETDFGKMGVNICYDVEFPELARALAHQGITTLVVPSCTDDRQGFLRVRYCAQARAIENQLYVVHSGTVGSLPAYPAAALNYAQASILSPSDFAFSRDGIVAEGIINQEAMVIGELNLRAIEENRSNGTVLALRDSARTREFLSGIQTVRLN
jgi:predicted amidohydrolase